MERDLIKGPYKARHSDETTDNEIEEVIKGLQRPEIKRTKKDRDEIIHLFMALNLFKKSMIGYLDRVSFIGNMIPLMKLEHYDKGDVICHYGSDADKLRVILRGKAKDFIPKTNEEIEKDKQARDAIIASTPQQILEPEPQSAMKRRSRAMSFRQGESPLIKKENPKSKFGQQSPDQASPDEILKSSREEKLKRLSMCAVDAIEEDHKEQDNSPPPNFDSPTQTAKKSSFQTPDTPNKYRELDSMDSMESPTPLQVTLETPETLRKTETREERAAGMRIVFHPVEGEPVEIIAATPKPIEKSPKFGGSINLNLGENKLFKARRDGSPRADDLQEQGKEIETPHDDTLSNNFANNPSWENVKMTSIPEESSNNLKEESIKRGDQRASSLLTPKLQMESPSKRRSTIISGNDTPLKNGRNSFRKKSIYQSEVKNSIFIPLSEPQVDEVLMQIFRFQSEKYFKDDILKIKFSEYLYPGDAIRASTLWENKSSTRAVVAVHPCLVVSILKEDYRTYFETEYAKVKPIVDLFKEIFPKYGTEFISQFQYNFTKIFKEEFDVIYQEGDPSDNLYLIGSGAVLLSKKTIEGQDTTKEYTHPLPLLKGFGKEKTSDLLISVLEKGTFFGEEFFFNAPRILKAVINSKTAEIFEMNKEKYEKLPPKFKPLVEEIMLRMKFSNRHLKERLGTLYDRFEIDPHTFVKSKEKKSKKDEELQEEKPEKKVFEIHPKILAKLHQKAKKVRAGETQTLTEILSRPEPSLADLLVDKMSPTHKNMSGEESPKAKISNSLPYIPRAFSLANIGLKKLNATNDSTPTKTTSNEPFSPQYTPKHLNFGKSPSSIMDSAFEGSPKAKLNYTIPETPKADTKNSIDERMRDDSFNFLPQERQVAKIMEEIDEIVETKLENEEFPENFTQAISPKSVLTNSTLIKLSTITTPTADKRQSSKKLLHTSLHAKLESKFRNTRCDVSGKFTPFEIKAIVKDRSELETPLGSKSISLSLIKTSLNRSTLEHIRYNLFDTIQPKSTNNSRLGTSPNLSPNVSRLGTAFTQGANKSGLSLGHSRVGSLSDYRTSLFSPVNFSKNLTDQKSPSSVLVNPIILKGKLQKKQAHSPRNQFPSRIVITANRFFQKKGTNQMKGNQ